MTAEEKAALDVLAILAGALVIFCVGAWFGWMSREAQYQNDHVSRRG